MDWKYWNGLRIFVQLKSGAVYSGKVIDVDETNKDSIFLTLIDKFGQRVSFVQTEIIKIKEEDDGRE